MSGGVQDKKSPSVFHSFWVFAECLAFLLATAGSCVAAGAESSPVSDCSDQAAALLPRIEPLVARFQEELRAARRTPRVSLPSGLWRLREIRRATFELSEWPESSCDFRLREKVEAAQSFEIRRLEAFMSGSRPDGDREARERWADAERHLKALRELVEATTSR